MEPMGNSGLLHWRNYDIRSQYTREPAQGVVLKLWRPLLRWISLSNKMIHTLIASTCTFLIIHGYTIYT